MKKLSCLNNNFGRNNRFVYFAAGGEKPIEDKSTKKEKPSEIPEAQRLTYEHVNQVLKAVKDNVAKINKYYKEQDVLPDRIPSNVKNMLANLNSLSGDLEKARRHPSQAHDVFVKIYAIFSRLKRQSRLEKKSGDPLLAGITDPDIRGPKLVTREEKLAAKESARKAKENERKSNEAAHLAEFNQGVRNLVSGEPMSQKYLDAIAAQFKSEGSNVLSRVLVLPRGTYNICLSLSPDRKTVNIQGEVSDVVLGKKPKLDRNARATTEVPMNKFSYFKSLDSRISEDKTKPFAVSPLNVLMAQAVAKGKKLRQIA